MTVTVNWPSTTGVLKFFGFGSEYALGNPMSVEQAMQRGRLVTRACELIAMGEPFKEGWEAQHLECAPYLDAYRKFFREHCFRLLEAETEYRCEAHRFVSHPDQVGFLDNFGPTDLELKSGSMPSWCPLQTGGQVLAMGDPKIRRFGLQLKDDGTYKLFPHEDFRDIDRFRSLVESYWTIQEFRNGSGDPPIS
jgi:hypothetical protein